MDRTLEQWAEAHRTEPWPERVAPLLDVGRALAELHGKDRAHGGVDATKISVGDNGRGILEVSDAGDDPGADEKALAGLLWEALYGDPPPPDSVELPRDPEVPPQVGAVVRQAVYGPPGSVARFLLAFDTAAQRRHRWRRFLIKFGIAGFFVGVLIAVAQLATASRCALPEGIPWSTPRLDAIGSGLYRVGADHDAWRASAQAFGDSWNAAFIAACKEKTDPAMRCLWKQWQQAEQALEAARMLDPETLKDPAARIDAIGDPSSCL